VAARASWSTFALVSVLSVIWGLNFIFIKIGLSDASALWLALLRAAVGTLGTAAVLSLLGAWRELDARGRRDALLLGIPNTTLFYAFLFSAIETVLPGIAAVLTYTFPLWVALLSPYVLRHRLTRRLWAAVAIGFGGVVLVSQPWTDLSGTVSLLAVVELLAAAVSWAVGTVLFQRRFRRDEMLEANGFQLVGGTVGLLALVVILAPTPLPSLTVGLGVTLLWLGVLGTAVAYTIWFYLLGRTKASTLSAYAFLVPVVALVASAFLFGERLTVPQLVGVALVLVSIYGIGRAPEAHDFERSVPPPPE
jgi:probable blue pigment (indigoidine) exporter